MKIALKTLRKQQVITSRMRINLRRRSEADLGEYGDEHSESDPHAT